LNPASLTQSNTFPNVLEQGVRASVVRFPGSNCDEDSVYALTTLGASVTRVWHTETDLQDADLVVLPGGFSYGDYLRSGAMAALSPVMTEVKHFAERGGLVLGICNGFQLLTEARLLPGALARNTELHFACERVTVRVENADTAFTNACTAGEILTIPIAHGEGRYVADAETLVRLEGENRVLFRYCNADGELTEEANPNGSLNSIAGIVSERGNVCGLMPHPERAVESLLGGTDGQKLFASVFRTLLEVRA
jgi:phosphoribosylformylglycinamidine synthase I